MDRRLIVPTFTRRRALQLAGGSAAAMFLGGCGGGDTQEVAEQAPGSDQLGGELRIAFLSDADSIEDPRAASFQERFPNVSLELVPIAGENWEDYFTRILTDVAAGNPPDLVNVATEGLQLFAGQGLSRPLDEFVQRDAADLEDYFSDVHPSLVESMMYEGNLYQLPDDWNAANMFFNTALMDAAGLELPGPQWTRDEFVQTARALAQTDDAQFAYGWPNRLFGSWMPWIFVNGGNLFSEERAPGGAWLWDRFYGDDPSAGERGGGWRWQEPRANSPEVVEALEFVLELREEELTPAVETGGSDVLQGIFASGQLGMTVGAGFFVGGLANAGMEAGSFDAQYWPAWQSQRHQFGAAGFAIMAESENQEAAWQWIKHISQRDVMEQRPQFQENTATAVRRSMVTAERYAETGPENWEVFYGTLDEYPDSAPIPAPPVANPMTQAFVRWTQVAMSGEETAQSALDQLQAELEGIVEEEGEMY